MQNVRAITKRPLFWERLGPTELVEYAVDVVEKVTGLSQILRPQKDKFCDRKDNGCSQFW
jgi:hypothetical protein